MQPLVLKVVKGPDSQRKFLLKAGRAIVVGRGSDSDTKIQDSALSRSHFKVELIGDFIQVEDLGSSSGTFVNGQKVATVMLDPGDQIKAGDSIFVVDVDRPTDINKLGGYELGGYKLSEVIATGQRGVVYRGFDQANERDVAVKVFLPVVTRTEEQRDRFVRAMRTMLPIKNPHIVELYEAGRTGPFCWAAMQYIEGEGLNQLIDDLGFDGKLMWQEVWRAVVHITRALHVGFLKNIVHRNVTPSNIIRRKRDKVCLLGDFMFAKAVEGNLAYDVTSPGQIVGNLRYLPPERMISNAEIDTRTDMYGLAATAYALLTGQAPGQGKAPMEIIDCIRNVTPTAPSEFQPGMDKDFEAILMKMMAKEPKDRFIDPQQLLTALKRVGDKHRLETDVSDFWYG